MKILLLITALITSYTSIAGNCSKQEQLDDFDSPIAYMDESNESIDYIDSNTSEHIENIELYYNALTKFLQQSDDINIQLSASANFKDNHDTKELKTILKQAIHPLSDKYTLFLASKICHNVKQLTDWCHQNKIHQVHYQVDPENLTTYLFSMHTGDNSEDINETIRQAALNSTYSDSFFFEYVIEQAQQVDVFNRENPELFETYIGKNAQQNIDYMQDMEIEITNLNLVKKGIIPADYLKT